MHSAGPASQHFSGQVIMFDHACQTPAAETYIEWVSDRHGVPAEVGIGRSAHLQAEQYSTEEYSKRAWLHDHDGYPLADGGSCKVHIGRLSSVRHAGRAS